ncbi:MAG: hypothetical protein AB1714_00010 [Acidobacteriota bacterium]
MKRRLYHVSIGIEPTTRDIALTRVRRLPIPSMAGAAILDATAYSA